MVYTYNGVGVIKKKEMSFAATWVGPRNSHTGEVSQTETISPTSGT